MCCGEITVGVLLQFLLLLGCFALFWSLYYTLEVALGHVHLRTLFCRGHAGGGRRAPTGPRGLWGVGGSLLEEASRDEEEQDSGVELQAVVESEAPRDQG